MSEFAFKQLSDKVEMLSYAERIRLLDKILTMPQNSQHTAHSTQHTAHSTQHTVITLPEK